MCTLYYTKHNLHYIFNFFWRFIAHKDINHAYDKHWHNKHKANRPHNDIKQVRIHTQPSINVKV
ncbi:hypothetical protein LS81_001545 [Helicobacter trogontum]|uniref:Uncharacterized protein n=1 Tax=Helicobacter trogontum TaxID=50960 RepID=A0A4U8TH53_9HELI|nr:hypothetical protein LS81_001545 [Helicobacter trogontum]TLD99529.1 hypothetical protein LS80_001015 [Helicobacter trogontum]